MIWINQARNRNKYHTENCRTVQEQNPRKVTDPALIEIMKSNREHCKFCSGEYADTVDKTDHSYHQAAENADQDDIEI